MKDVLLISGSISETLAISLSLTQEERDVFTTILWNTVHRSYIYSLIPFLFPNVKYHVTAYTPGSKSGTVDVKNFRDIFESRITFDIPSIGRRFNYESIMNYEKDIIFNEIASGKRKCYEEGLRNQKYSDISKFNLPDSYLVIHPYSQSCSGFTSEEWDKIIEKCYTQEVLGVVLNAGSEILKRNKRILDLTNQTTILESIEILLRTESYIGVGSFLAVLACKILHEKDVMIKISNEEFLNSISEVAYCAPLDPNKVRRKEM